MSNFTELSTLSTILNQQSNQVNELLKEFEQKLYAMNLGVEVWAYDDPLTTSPTSFYDGIKDQEYRESHDMVLGWGRLGEKFGLLVLSVKYRWELGKWVMIDENPRTPLLQAPREIRIAALGKIEALISALRERAQELVNSIKTAQQTIEKL